MWGTKLRFKQSEIRIQFKYEQLPTFCFYCGCVGRKDDLGLNCLKGGQFGPWLQAGYGIKSMGGTQVQRVIQEQAGTTGSPGQVLEGEVTAEKEMESGEGEIKRGEEGSRGWFEVQKDMIALIVQLPDLPLINLEQEQLEPLRIEVGLTVK